MNLRSLIATIVVGLLIILGMNSVFTVSEVERAVLLEFGRVVNADLKPGLHFKKPFINDVRRFDARVLTLDAPAERFLTLEKKAVIVDSFAKWRVFDVQKFYTSTSGDMHRASQLLLKPRVNTGLRNQISKRSMHEVVSGERDLLMSDLTRDLNIITREELGIEIIDIRVKRIDLPTDVSQSVYDRMNTERQIEAAEHRAKGQELALGIRADADRQAVVIEAEAFRTAEETRGEGDATSAAIYAGAFTQDAEFYSFYRSMNAYKKTFSNKGDILLIDPKSDFFNYLNNSKATRK
jgi:membrane protease subunit HflC